MGMWVKRINYKKRQKTKKRGGGGKTSNCKERVKKSPFCQAYKPHEGSIAGNKTRKVG